MSINCLPTRGAGLIRPHSVYIYKDCKTYKSNYEGQKYFPEVSNNWKQEVAIVRGLCHTLYMDIWDEILRDALAKLDEMTDEEIEALWPM